MFRGNSRARSLRGSLKPKDSFFFKSGPQYSFDTSMLTLSCCEVLAHQVGNLASDVFQDNNLYYVICQLSMHGRKLTIAKRIPQEPTKNALK